MEFRDLTLDKFQEQAVEHVDNNESVVVSAATGTGKTLIADYVIDASFKKGKKVFYTSPIKALSNQKFREFKEAYGEKAVGILTGDVVINPKAPLLIMTTEIYRNMLLVNDPITDDLAFVVFDEIHFLGDKERGTAWEEAIIFSPEHVRFLCLSATIPNAKQFANWIESIMHHKVHVVTEKIRAVPLEHKYFDNKFGMSTIKEIQQRKKQGEYPNYRQLRKRRQPPKQKKLNHLNLVNYLEKKNWLPCIYFCFSRASTEKLAEQLAHKKSYLTKDQQKIVDDYLQEQLQKMDPSIRNLETTRKIVFCLKKGVAFHHAGILPRLKELVENIFAKNCLYVLYATETFAVGINLPAKSVCFDSLEKYDGTEFRYLHSQEYFQLAGRAGRRGMDKVGYAISVVDPEYGDLQTIENLTTIDNDVLESQYKLSYNTILNLIANHTEKERNVILKSSFYTYQKAGKQSERILKQYAKKVKLLQKLNYLDGDTLTERGEFARKIYSHELILTELFTTDLVEEFSNVQIALLAAGLEFEPRPRITFKKLPTPETKQLAKIFRPYKSISSYFKRRQIHKIEPFLSAWMSGGEFTDILNMTTMPEGDIVRFFRRIIDVLQQVQHATTNPELRVRIDDIIRSIDRDVVEVRL